jgi:hypothetical protein
VSDDCVGDDLGALVFEVSSTAGTRLDVHGGSWCSGCRGWEGAASPGYASSTVKVPSIPASRWPSTEQ